MAKVGQKLNPGSTTPSSKSSNTNANKHVSVPSRKLANIPAHDLGWKQWAIKENVRLDLRRQKIAVGDLDALQIPYRPLTDGSTYGIPIQYQWAYTKASSTENRPQETNRASVIQTLHGVNKKEWGVCTGDIIQVRRPKLHDESPCTSPRDGPSTILEYRKLRRSWGSGGGGVGDGVVRDELRLPGRRPWPESGGGGGGRDNGGGRKPSGPNSDASSVSGEEGGGGIF